MILERQRIEAPPTPPPGPSIDNSMPPPPSYEEVNGVFASQAYNGSTDAMGYFLGEVACQFPFSLVYLFYKNTSQLCSLFRNYVYRILSKVAIEIY